MAAMYRYLFFIALFLLTVSALQAQQHFLDLSGIWRFALDKTDRGIKDQWFSQTLAGDVKLPGSLIEQNIGDDITLETQWTGSIYDSSFYFNPRLEKYRQPGNIHIPFWLTPAKHYVGAAWYQKEITIPENWKGRRVVLHLERAHIETRVWIDGKEIGMANSLVAAHEFELPRNMAPGKHRISIRVDNRLLINVGPDSHSVSDHTQGNWNGLVGKLSLEAGSPIYFDEIQVFPDLKNRKAQVRIALKNSGADRASGEIVLSANSFNSLEKDKTDQVTADFSVGSGDTDTLSVDLSFSNKMQVWDEFNPALYTLTATLKTGKEKSIKELQFGMREFTIEGNRFLINGRPVFLRGTLHNGEFPLTGYPATTVEAWKDIFETAKSHGLNHIRFHSWCPPEAAFIAADIVGMYLQPEGPSWPNHGVKIGVGEPIDQYLYDETDRIVEKYGNYASFVMLSAGNEPAGDQVRYLNEFVDYWKRKDSRRVYTGMSVGGSWPVVPHAEFQVRGGVRGLAWDKRPETVSDFREAISKFDVPFVAHENGQYCVFPNFDEIQKYTGAYRAKNLELFRQDLTDQGMGKQAHDFLMASGKLQVLCYKHDMEKILRTPGYAGFQLLGLQDFPGQGSALVGVLDAFWEEKGYIEPAAFARFCNSTVPLARFPKFVFTNNERLDVQIDLFHSGVAPIENAVLNWAIKDTDGKSLASGNLDAGMISNGNGIPVGHISYPLHTVTAPSQLKLEVSVAGTDFLNDWDFWVYPEKVVEMETDIHYTTVLDDQAKEILNNGGKVFLNVSGQVVKGKEVEMHFLPVFWNTSWFKMRPPHVTGMLIDSESDAFSQFPTSYHSDLQWWDIQNRAQVMILEDFPVGFRPLVQPIDTWFINRRLGLVFEAKVGNGKLVMSSADLHADIDRPASKQLFKSLITYMGSDKFDPTEEVDMAVVEDIMVSPSKQQYKIYTVDSPDELMPNSNRNKK